GGGGGAGSAGAVVGGARRLDRRRLHTHLKATTRPAFRIGGMTQAVVILGGGFGGLTAEAALGDRARVTIVSDQNSLLFTPMLAEVAAGDLDPRHIITPIRQLVRNARVVAGAVEPVDVASRTVKVVRPIGLQPIDILADSIVVALGSVPATYGVAGVAEWALPFKTIS